MRNSMILLMAALAGSLGGCSPPEPLVEASASMVGNAVRCIDPHHISARRVTGPNSLLFELPGVTYRNDLREACPGLGLGRDFKIIQLEVQGGQLCSGDSFRAFDPSEASAVGAEAFPRCRLGAFTPIATRQQLAR